MTLDTYLSDQTEWLLKRLTGNKELDREYVRFTLQRVAEQVAADVEIKGDEAATVENPYHVELDFKFPEPPSIKDITLNSEVTHPKFGLGKVLFITKTGEESQYTKLGIFFQDGGYKELLAEFAKLKIEKI